ncbi:P1 family peptidase [Flexivirga sp. ID2601S]|uniref:P1 family peptidase n=1 Tax=Flexivirga aerilata TaxID=1656889 RepID=A0A849AF71_9MICO|nr:P1 family peptidase [Flexivirga aerilata]NNG37828.1 P1 family peptidase [Flexivirga aerilata]
MSTPSRARARDLGVAPGDLGTGEHNAITDVPGVRVGHTTLDDGDLHTGVTAIVPDALDRAGGRLPAGLFVGNGYGKLVGATQLAELGELETPILLTGTLSAFRVADALVSYVLDLPGNESVISLNPVVGETNDGYLSDGRRRPITAQHVRDAIRSAAPGPVAEGCVGAGAGTVALGFKGGIGTSSRVVPLADGRGCTLGVLVQSNFSGTLTVAGVPVKAPKTEAPQGNSCMIIVACDAGVDSRQLGRMAKRAVFAMGRVGADYAGGSGDYAIAFDTAAAPSGLPDTALDPIFRATQDAVEEALLNSLFMATTTTGFRGRTRQAVPLDQVARRAH